MSPEAQPSHVRPVLWVALLLVLSFAAAPARAQADARVSVTNTFITEYWGENRNGIEDDDNFVSIRNRLNLIGNAGTLSLNARMDTFVFISPPTDAYTSEARLERLTGVWAPDRFRLEIGDFYEQVGRGIALAVRKVDEAALDVSIRGGHAALRWDRGRVRAFAGLTNPANLDAINQRHVDDANDIVAGSVLELRLHRRWRMETWGVYLQPETSLWDRSSRVIRERVGDNAREDRTINLGLSHQLSDLTDWLSIYVEGGWQTRSLLGEEQTGLSAYGTIDLLFGDTTILLEGLHLDDWIMDGSPNKALSGIPFRYNQGPTLERIDQEVLELNNVTGGRGRLEHLFFDIDLTLHGNVMYRITRWGRAEETQQLHAWGGFEQRYQEGRSRMQLSGGWRDERATGTGERLDFKTMIHFEGDLAQALRGGWVLHAATWNEFRTLEGRPFRRGSTWFGMEKSGLGSLTYELGYDDQNAQPGIRRWFHAAIARWDIDARWTLLSTVGTQRGGIKCVNGVCREYPGFAGARIEVITRF